MRRRTLGVISHNQVNKSDGESDKKSRRFSMAPSRKSLDRKSGKGVRFSSGTGRASIGFASKGRPSVGKGRQSMGRQSLGRRSSMYNRSGKISDPRPLSDRKFMNKNTRILVEYLTEHNYDKQITPKQVTAPSLKDFKNISGFLFKQMDPNFEFSKNFEEDIRDVLKKLGYPFTISKSSLASVGSPHTWPPILAMLVWVIELLKYLEELEDEEEKNVENDDAKMFFEYLAGAYKNFLDENDDSGDLEDDFRAAYEHRCLAVKDEIKRFEEENQELQRELELLSSDVNTVSGLQQKLQDYMSDLGKFEKLISILEKKSDSISDKTVAAEKELKLLEGEKQTFLNEQEELKTAIEQQPLSREEVQRITQETKMKQDAIDSVLKQKEQTKRESWNTEMLQCKIIGNIEDLTLKYNNLVSELDLTPSTSKNAMGIEYQVSFQPNASNIKDMVSQDLTHSVKPGLQRLEEKFKAMNRSLETQLRDVKQEILRTQDLRAEADSKVKHQEERLAKMHETYRTERRNMNKQCAESVSAIEEIELQIHRTRAAQTNDLRISEQKVREIEQQLKVQIKEQADAEKKAEEDIANSVEKLASHKDWLINTLAKTSDEVIYRKEDVEKMCATTFNAK